MRGLKALVIGMGILIAVGLGVIVVTIAKRGSDGGTRASAGFDRARVELPRGARIVGTEAEGDRLLVRLELAGGATRILVIDLRTGAARGTIDLVPQR